MDLEQIWQAVILGIVEGLTEFIPVSSTGHLIVLQDIIGFVDPGKTFTIAIQLGAICAVCFKYFDKLFGVASSMHSKKASRDFTRNVIVAFLPAAIIGVFAHGYIKEVLFDPTVVAISLIVGGFIILIVERYAPKPKTKSVDEMSWKTALKIGFFQTIAMIPGVSRSGATIMGAMTIGVERKAATEFSFFLAIPTMLGATVYDLYKNWEYLNADSLLIIAVGFIMAFIAALIVINWVINFISTHGFKPFAYYRIMIGALILYFLN